MSVNVMSAVAALAAASTCGTTYIDAPAEQFDMVCVRAIDADSVAHCLARSGAFGAPATLQTSDGREDRLLIILEPTRGFEPRTYGLRNRCSTS
jgi:hypothetical protein